MNILIGDSELKQPITSLFDIQFWSQDVYKNTPSDSPGILNDSSMRIISSQSDMTWDEVHKALYKFSLKKKYNGRLFLDNKVVRGFFMKHYALNEIKVKGEISALDFMANNKSGTYILFINVGEPEYYCIFYKDGEYEDAINRLTKLNRLLLCRIEYIMIPDDQAMPEGVYKKNGKYRIKCKYNSMLDLLKIPMKNNTNTLKRQINDCTIRAISYVTNKSYDDIYKELTEYSMKYNKESDKEERFIFATSKITHNYITKELKWNYIELGERVNISRIKFMVNNKKGKFIISSQGHMFVYDNGTLVDNLCCEFDEEDFKIWLDKQLILYIEGIYYDNNEEGVIEI